MGFTLDHTLVIDSRCLRESAICPIGKYFYLWVEQMFSYGDSDPGPMQTTATPEQ